KSFQSVEVIHGVDLTVESGAFAVFVGPSGCGKLTLLRMIAGLEDVTAGEIRLDGQRCEHLLPSRRGMADGGPVLCALSAHERAGEPALRARLPQGSKN